MISDLALDLAVERSLITATQADGLRSIEQQLSATSTAEPLDDEKLRFLTGFADIFVTLGILLFLGAIALLMGTGTRIGLSLTCSAVAVCSWLLAEFFTRRRRMALPSIVLLVAFCGAVFAAAEVAAASVRFGLLTTTPDIWAHRLDFMSLGIAAIFTAAAAALHYWRFRVPITIAAGAAALCVLVFSITTALVPGLTGSQFNILIFLCGLAVFALAMRFDMQDPRRETRRTDIAFWLHLLGAPLIVHPLIRGFLHGLDESMTIGSALDILWAFLALGVVAVIIDRRAILVSGLVYAGVAFGAVIRTLGVTKTDLAVPVVLLALGAFILLLSAGWQPLRRMLLNHLPGALARRLPHPLVQSHT